MIHPFHDRRNVQPYRPAVLDIETGPDGDVLDIGFGFDDSDGNSVYRVFPHWGDWIDFVADEVEYRIRRNKPTRKITTIYAHNGASFDYLSLIDYCRNHNIISDVQIIMAGGVAIGITLQVHDVTFSLCDSFRLIPAGLDDLCKSYGIENGKLTVPDEYKSKMDEYKIKFNDDYYRYLERDVESLRDVLFKFWSSVVNIFGKTIGNLPMTLPSLALKLWRTSLTKPVATTTNREVIEMERMSYTGGRNECWETGIGMVRVYDANSLYPTMMDRTVTPIAGAGGFCHSYQGNVGLYQINYKQKNRNFPPVLRDYKSGEFRYTGSGVYTHLEIDKLIDMGGEFEFIKGYEYLEVGNLFKNFVRPLYDMRLKAQLEHDDAMSFTIKILLNSLYGKFAQREVGTAIVYDADSVRDKILSITELGEFVVVETERGIEHVFCGLASYITSSARCELYDKMCAVIKSGKKLYTVDTDSIHCSDDFDLPTGAALGEWKLEFHGEGAYAGPKLYALRNGSYEKVKAKGIGKLNRNRKLTYDDIVELIETDGVLEIGFATFPSVREICAGTKQPCKLYAKVRTIKVTARDNSCNGD